MEHAISDITNQILDRCLVNIERGAREGMDACHGKYAGRSSPGALLCYPDGKFVNNRAIIRNSAPPLLLCRRLARCESWAG